VRSVKSKSYLNDETPDKSKSKRLQPELELSNHEDWFRVGVLPFHGLPQCMYNVMMMIYIYLTNVVKSIRTFRKPQLVSEEGVPPLLPVALLDGRFLLMDDDWLLLAG
jgi:hypothetical protein